MHSATADPGSVSRPDSQPMGLCRVVTWVVFAVIVAGITACGSSSAPAPKSGTTLSGVVRGGTQPISGATIVLWQSGTGYGDGAIALSTATSNSKGAFKLRGIKCPASDAETYLTALGGNAGGGVNPAIGLLTALGPCKGLSRFGKVAVNELTTVAGEWSLGQFSDASGQDLGAPSTNPLGIPHSISLANTNLVDPRTGAVVSNLAAVASSCSQASPPASCVTLEKLNTLADMLAACVASNGTSSTACVSLFSGAGIAPSTTLGAAHAMATNPAANPKTLYAIIASPPPFQPIVSSSPGDLRVTLNYSGADLNGPFGIALDSTGNAWIVNAATPSITELNYLGAQTGFFEGGGLSAPHGIAIDGESDVWVSNFGNSSVTEFPASSRASPVNFTGGGLNEPVGIAVDNFGIIWLANEGNDSVTALCGAIPADCPNGATTGTPLSPGSGFVGGGLGSPLDVALDSNGNIWAANCGTLCSSALAPRGTISQFCGFVGAAHSSCGGAAAGTPLSPASGYQPPGIDVPIAIAVDTSFNVYVPNFGDNSVSFFPSLGGTGASFSGGGLSSSAGIALDGAGFLWVTNTQGGSPVEMGTVSYLAGANPPPPFLPGEALSPSIGFFGAGLEKPQAIAIDSSGDVWVGNANDGSVTEFVGAAAPVQTPRIGPPVPP